MAWETYSSHLETGVELTRVGLVVDTNFVQLEPNTLGPVDVFVKQHQVLVTPGCWNPLYLCISLFIWDPVRSTKAVGHHIPDRVASRGREEITRVCLAIADDSEAIITQKHILDPLRGWLVIRRPYLGRAIIS